jgi:hypothetical protein
MVAFMNERDVGQNPMPCAVYLYSISSGILRKSRTKFPLQYGWWEVDVKNFGLKTRRTNQHGRCWWERTLQHWWDKRTWVALWWIAVIVLYIPDFLAAAHWPIFHRQPAPPWSKCYISLDQAWKLPRIDYRRNNGARKAFSSGKQSGDNIGYLPIFFDIQ